MDGAGNVMGLEIPGHPAAESGSPFLSCIVGHQAGRFVHSQIQLRFLQDGQGCFFRFQGAGFRQKGPGNPVSRLEQQIPLDDFPVHLEGTGGLQLLPVGAGKALVPEKGFQSLGQGGRSEKKFHYSTFWPRMQARIPKNRLSPM